MKWNLAHAVLPFAFLAGMTCAAQNPSGVGPSDGGPRLSLGGFGNSTPKPQPAQRVIQGVVRDKEGAPMKGALVYLKDERTARVKSMVADDKGSFRFVQLSRTTDYKVWAQTKENRSPEKSITSFETKDEIIRDLKVDQPLPPPAVKKD